MADQITNVPAAGGDGGGGMGTGMVVGVIVVILIIIGLFIIFGRGTTPVTPDQQVPAEDLQGAPEAEINLPSEVDLNVNQGGGGEPAPAQPQQ